MPAWEGTKILEFGAGAAGPIATRYFAEHGATVLRVESPEPARLPARLRARPRQPARPRRLDRCSTGSTPASSASPSTSSIPRRSRSARAAGRRVGRRGGRELRPPGHARLRPRLRQPRRAQARPGDDQRLPERPDRSAPRLPRLRRPGRGAVGLQLAHRLARPRAGRAATPRSPTRSRPGSSPPRSPPASSTGAAPGGACTSTSSQVEAGIYSLTPWLLDYELDGVIGMRDGQPRPIRTRRAPRRLPVRGRRPLDRDRVLDRRRVARARRPHRPRPATGPRLPSGATHDDEVEKLRRRRGPRQRDARELSRAAPGDAASRPCRSTTSATSTTTPRSRHREHFVPLTHPVPGRRALRAQRVPPERRAERLRAPGPDPRPGQRLRARRAPRPLDAEQESSPPKACSTNRAHSSEVPSTDVTS